MLAVSFNKYELPLKVIDSDNLTVSWSLTRRNSTANDRIEATKFAYTFDLLDEEANIDDRFTAIYDGDSVKPAPRTLRVFGADSCSRVVSLLSSMTTKPEWDVGKPIGLHKRK